jgi:putative redox protein
MGTSKIQISASLGEKFKVQTTVRGNTVYIDQPTEAGGTNAGINPLEMTLYALSGCIAHIARIVAMQKKLAFRAMQVEVEGEIDKDYLLGKTQAGRAGYTKIAARVKIDADLTADEKKAFLHEVERRCPVSDNLVNPTSVDVSLAE